MRNKRLVINIQIASKIAKLSSTPKSANYPALLLSKHNNTRES